MKENKLFIFFRCCLLLMALLNIFFNKNVMAQNISPRSGNINFDFDISTKTPEILSGNDAVFQLDIKVTGSQVLYENVNLFLNLPSNATLFDSLENLKINDVIPTMNKSKNRLEYHFKQVNPGQTDQLLLKFHTENGLPNDSEIKLSGEIEVNDVSVVNTESTIKIKSVLTQVISKKYNKTTNLKGVEQIRSPIEGDIGVWSLSFNLPNHSVGQEYLKPGSKIIIKDVLPKHLEYISDNSNGEYNSKEHAVTWTFIVPPIEDQKSSDFIFFKDIDLQTKFITKSEEKNITIQNNMTTDVLNLDEMHINDATSATVIQGPSSNSIPIIPTDGNALAFQHYGPANGAGTIAGGEDYNPNPTVSVDSLLKFLVIQRPLYATSPDKNFESYETFYKIDNQLEIKKLKQTKDIVFMPYAEYPGVIKLSDEASKINVYATVNGVEKRIITNIIPGKEYDRAEFENYNNESSHISELRYESTFRHAGISTYQELYFSPISSARGEVTNRLHINYKGYNLQGKKEIFTSNYDSETFSVPTNYAGPRNANVSVNNTSIPLPIVSTSVEFSNTNNGLIDIGNNQLKGSLKVDPTSHSIIKGPYSFYVLLPKGVKYESKNINKNSEYNVELITDKYDNKPQELVKVDWKKNRSLAPGESLSFEFPITVKENALSQVIPELYTYIGTDKFKVPSYNNELITNTNIISNTMDLNGSGDINQKLMLTKNKYGLLRSNKIVGKEYVKGDLNSEFSNFGYTNIDGNIDYKIELANHGVDSDDFVLMNILPSIGDLGITDNKPLGTRFNPRLIGPVTLPNSNINEFEIYYSTSKNPSRKDLIENVDWPATTQKMEDPIGAENPEWLLESQVGNWEQINSFLIKSKKGYPIQNQEKIVITFSMKAPQSLAKELTNPVIPGKDRAAWNSFAYTINRLQPVEPNKVGVAVNEYAYNLKIIKEDTDSKKKLKDAEFTLYDSNKSILETIVSNNDGEIIFNNLQKGTYYLQETKAPPGYTLNKKLYELEILENGEVNIKNSDAFITGVENVNKEDSTITLSVSNKIKHSLPFTGSYVILLSFVIFVIIIVIYSILYTYLKLKGDF